jgi:hypothetical protein
MESNFFLDKSVQPDDTTLPGALGSSYNLWKELRGYLENEYGKLTEEWKFYSPKSGWTMKLLYKKRNLFFFTAYNKYFRLGFVFGDKAVAEIEKSDLPKPLIEELVNAKKYAEGRGLRIEVRTKKDVANVKKLVEMKIKN